MQTYQSGGRLTFAEPLTGSMKVLLALFTVLVVPWVLSSSFQQFAIDRLALNPDRFIADLHLWQAVTSIFLHAGIPHFLGNMIFFWLFGSALAVHWTRREFLFYFFLCGIGSSLCSYGYDLVLGQPIPSLGASGAIFGLMAAYALIFGDRTILAFFLIPMKVRHFVAILFGIEFLLVLGGAQDGIGHVAHVSGAVCGAVYLLIMRRWRARQTSRDPTHNSRFSSLEIGSD